MQLFDKALAAGAVTKFSQSFTADGFPQPVMLDFHWHQINHDAIYKDCLRGAHQEVYLFSRRQLEDLADEIMKRAVNNLILSE